MKRRRIISLVLIVLMLLGTLPTASFAATSRGTSREATDDYCPSGRSGNNTHLFGEWDIMEEPTCAAPGSESRWCSYCFYEQKREIPALGHNWSDWVTVEEATCTSEGLETRYCSSCRTRETRRVAKKAHTWGNPRVIVDPTCTYAGSAVYTCQVCKTQETRAIDRLPHTWGEWTTTQEPTCTQAGSRQRTCSVCGTVETEAIPMIAHTYGGWTVVTAATCTSAGTEKGVCQVCGHEEIRAVAPLAHTYGDWTILSQLTDLSLGIRERACLNCGAVEHIEEEPAGTLHYGDQGEAVLELQKTLNENGYDCGYPDGHFGDLTKAAIADLESDNDLPPDGIGWPGVMRIMHHNVELPINMNLSVEMPPTTIWAFKENDGVSFLLHLTNTYSEHVKSFTVYQMSETETASTEWVGVATGGFLASGYETVIPVSYTVTKADADCGWTDVLWYVSAETESGKTIYSNDADHKLDCSAGNPEMEVYIEGAPVIAFTPGAQANVTLCIHNTGAETLSLHSIDLLPVDSVSHEAWMDDYLQPGETYKCTLTMTLSDYESTMYMAMHAVDVSAVDINSGIFTNASATAYAVRRVEGPSMIVIPADDSGLEGGIGDKLSLPVLVVNNGSEDLRVKSITDEWYTLSIIQYNEACKTLFASGKSFVVDYTMIVSALEMGFGCGDRVLCVIADVVSSGEEIKASEHVHFAYNGPRPKLVLSMVQTTPDQDFWTPDAEGKLPQMVYTVSVKNQGDRPAVLSAVGLKMDPSASVYNVEWKLDIPVELAKGESHSFSITLDLDETQILPGTATEQHDGVIQPAFVALAGDPSDDPHNYYNKSNEVSYTYKVKKDAFSWTPPGPGEDDDGKDGDTSPAGVEPDSTVGWDVIAIYKELTSRGSIQITPSFPDDDLYCLNDVATFEISFTNTSSETLYDVEVVDLMHGVETVVATFSSVAPDEEKKVPVSYTVTAQDVIDGEVINKAWVTCRVGTNSERDTSYLGEAWFFTTDTPKPTGTPSDDIKIVKTAYYNGYLASQYMNKHIPEGADVLYTIELENTSKHTITNISISDMLADPANPTFATVDSLAPGEKKTVEYHYFVTPKDVEDGYVDNIAVAEWTGDDGPHYAIHNWTIDTSHAALKVTKTATSNPDDAAGYQEGETVHYKITVQNMLDEHIGDVDISDPLYKKETGEEYLNGTTYLEFDAHEIKTFEFDYTVDATDVINTKIVSVATAHWSLHESFDSDIVTTPTIPTKQSVSVVKTVETGGAADPSWTLDETVQGVVVVTNNSKITLYDLTVTDIPNQDPVGYPLGFIYKIDPGESAKLPWIMTVTQSDVDRGHMTNGAYVVWPDPYTKVEHKAEADEITMNTYGEKTPTGISITKVEDSSPSVNPSGYVLNETVYGTVIVTNNEDHAYHSVAVYDLPNGDTTGILLGTIPTLLPKATQTLTWSMTVTATDVSRTYITNGARVEWTEHDTGEKRSNEAVEIQMATWDETPVVYGGLTVTKSVVGTPDNGEFYQEGEKIEFHVTVTNSTGQDLTSYTVYEPMVEGGILDAGGFVANGGILYDGSFFYEVNSIDVGNKEVTNVVNVHAEGADGTKYIALSTPATAKTGKEKYELVKTYVWNCKNGLFWTEGEYIYYTITFTNNSDQTVDKVTFHDWLEGHLGTDLGEALDIAPGESVSVHFKWKVQYVDCDGALINYANCVIYVGEEKTSLYADPVAVPTGMRKITPDPTPRPTPAPEPGPGYGEYCERTLTGKGDGTREYELVYCAEHGAIAEQVKTLVEQGAPDAWDQALALWMEALNAEYDELITAASEAEKPIITDERVQFILQIECYRASLEARDPEHAAMRVCELLRDKVAELCYEAHTAPDERVDSIANGLWKPILSPEAGPCCETAAEATEHGVLFRETLCGRHSNTDKAVDVSVGAADSAEKRASAWQRAMRLWLAELDAQTNQRYRAADADGRQLIAAERVSFGNWLNAREIYLRMRYSGRQDIVSEILTDAIRARVMDLCD